MVSLVGSRVERKEDKRFLTGKGRYTADINLANQTYAIFVRSPHARASIKKLNIDKALKSSGVVGVLTGKEIAEDKMELNDKHQKLRASVSLAKDGIKEMTAVVGEKE